MAIFDMIAGKYKIIANVEREDEDHGYDYRRRNYI